MHYDGAAKYLLADKVPFNVDVACSGTGNWICCDHNCRLVVLEEIRRSMLGEIHVSGYVAEIEGHTCYDGCLTIFGFC